MGEKQTQVTQLPKKQQPLDHVDLSKILEIPIIRIYKGAHQEKLKKKFFIVQGRILMIQPSPWMNKSNYVSKSRKTISVGLQ